jgi:hypothetical protein
MDDVYGVSRATKKLYRITVSASGAYQPVAANDGSILYAAFSARGYHLHRLPADSVRLMPFDPVPLDQLANPINEIAKFEGGDLVPELENAPELPTKRYNPDGKLFNIHSWAPLVDAVGPQYNLYLISENIMSTMQAQFLVGWNQTERAGTTGALMQYSRHYPVFNASAFYYERNSPNTNTRNLAEFRLGSEVPLRQFAGNYFQQLSIGGGFSILDFSYRNEVLNRQEGQPFGVLDFKLSASTLHRTALRQPYSPQGFMIDAVIRNAPFDNDRLSMMEANAKVFLPGLATTHNLVFSGGFRYEPTSNQVTYVNTFRLPRGYLLPDADGLRRISAHYTFPIAYFHRNAGAMMYANRMRGLFYYDYGQSFRSETFMGARRNANMRSFGGELILDTIWFRLVPLELVGRGGVRLDDNGAKRPAGGFFEVTVGVAF